MYNPGLILTVSFLLVRGFGRFEMAKRKDELSIRAYFQGDPGDL